MNRDAFLERVREAAQRGRAHRVHVDPPSDGAGYVGAGADLCAALAEQVAEVGGVARVLAGAGAVADSLAQLLDECGAKSALCWQHAVLERVGVERVLAERGIEMHDYAALVDLPPAERRERILAADVGISSVDFAIAETGTLVVCSQPGQERVTSLLPPVHIAIVERSQIVPDLFDVFARLSAAGLENLPSNLSFITGPSKTGDIELQLTTGVHGPGQWHVLIENS